MLFEQNVLTITLLLFSCQLTQSSGYIRKYIFLMFLRDIERNRVWNVVKNYGNRVWRSTYMFILKKRNMKLHFTHSKGKYGIFLRLNKILNVCLSIKYLDHRVLNHICMHSNESFNSALLLMYSCGDFSNLVFLFNKNL